MTTNTHKSRLSRLEARAPTEGQPTVIVRWIVRPNGQLGGQQVDPTQARIGDTVIPREPGEALADFEARVHIAAETAAEANRLSRCASVVFMDGDSAD